MSRMNKKKEFERINSVYSQLSKFHSTDNGFFGSSICTEILELFKKIKIKNSKRFIDIGSGDGRVVLIASLFTKAVGIESDKDLFELSNSLKKRLLLDNASFVHDDFFNINLRDYDIIFIFPDKPFYRGLELKLAREMKKDAILIVYGSHFLPERLNLKKKVDVSTEVFVYSIQK